MGTTNAGYVDDIADKHIVRVGKRIGVIQGRTFHTIEVTVSGSDLKVGCVTIALDAWHLLNAAIGKAIAQSFADKSDSLRTGLER
jgi:hypothetical protein